MLPSLTLIILFQFAGTFIQQYFSSPIPSAVIGMILFLLYLCLTGGGNDKLMDTGSQLLKHLALFFIPAGVGILVYTEELKAQGIAIMASLTIGTLIAFVFTLLLFQKLAPRDKGQNHDK